MDPNQHEFVSLAPSELKSQYFFAISAVVPRPIALVGSVSADGVANLAPFSHFGLMGHDPFTLAVTFCANSRKTPPEKDSLSNLKATGDCTVQVWLAVSAPRRRRCTMCRARDTACTILRAFAAPP